MTATVRPMMTTSQNKPSMTRSRTRQISTLLLALLLCGSPLFAQTGTVMPVPKQQFLDNNGNPLAAGKLYTYAAGTTTPLATYTDVGLSVANANPVILDSAGRATVFLTSASYKFVLATSADVTIWTQDNVSSVAPFNVDLDITGTAGEAISAGELVYLAAGTGGTTAGRWYKADADLAYASLTASQWGMAPSAIAAAASGSIRVTGRVTGLSGLSTGSDYFASATAGALTPTAPTNALKVGRADSATSLILGNFLTPAGPRGPPCGRLTLTTGVPVTTADVTAATTVYYTPYGGCNTLSLFNGSAWQQTNFAELSIAVPATTVQMYDVFAYDNAGVVALELTAWTNDTTRATVLAKQDGVYVKTGALTRLYLGSFRTTGVSGQTEDSGFTCVTAVPKRYLYNYYHRQQRPVCHVDTNANWSYTLATIRQARGSALNQVEVVNGVAESPIVLAVQVLTTNASARASVLVAIGENSTTTAAAGLMGGTNRAGIDGSNSAYATLQANLVKVPPVGFSYYAWLEAAEAAGSEVWYGGTLLTGGASSGLNGWVMQ